MELKMQMGIELAPLGIRQEGLAADETEHVAGLHKPAES